VKSFSKSVINSYLNDLSSTKPAPGGGSAAAVVVALGCALLGKVANISQEKSGKSFKAELKSVASLRKEALKLADLDASVYTKVVKAYQVKAKTDLQKKKRKASIDKVLELAFGVPCDLLVVIKKAEQLKQKLSKRCKGAIASDLDVATDFFGGAAKSAKHLAVGNIDYIRDKKIQSKLKKKLAKAI
jgi:formiminotetrahydrofolate cyclodeaminase